MAQGIEFVQLPGESAQHFLQRYLRTVTIRAIVTGRQPSQSRYRCYEHLVWDLGEAWEAQPLPSNVHPGEMRLCYMNTLTLIRHARAQGLELDYCEGFALDCETGAPWLHAWAVDRGGGVWDRTWPDSDRCAYYGIRFRWYDVERFDHLGDDYLGIIPSQFLLGNPLMKFGRLFPEDGPLPPNVHDITWPTWCHVNWIPMFLSCYRCGALWRASQTLLVREAIVELVEVIGKHASCSVPAGGDA